MAVVVASTSMPSSVTVDTKTVVPTCSEWSPPDQVGDQLRNLTVREIGLVQVHHRTDGGGDEGIAFRGARGPDR